MKRLNVTRAYNYYGLLSPSALAAWVKLWELPPKNLVNLRTAAELMTEQELEQSFELWHKVVIEDINDARRRRVDRAFKVRTKRKKEVRNHILELYVLIREVLLRHTEGRLDVDDLGGHDDAGEGAVPEGDDPG